MTCRICLVLLLSLSLSHLHAFEVNEWRHRQTIEIPSAGLVRIDLPAETLNAARPALEDLRVIDGAGNEVPFAIERPTPRPESTRRPKAFRSALGNQATTGTIQTGVTGPVAAVTLETPATEFLKSVRVEASHDGAKWQELAADQPIFRMPRGVEKLRLDFPPGRWEFLRVTLDDQRTAAIPVTGAQIHLVGAPAPSEPVAIAIKSRDENPGVTRLALDLGAANLPLASLRLESPERLFTRRVSVAVPEVSEQTIRERTIAERFIFRVDLAGRNEARLDLPLEQQIPARDLFLYIDNGDSPPLQVSAVRGERRLVRLVFFAGAPGSYTLLSGNAQCAAPRYDLSALGSELQSASAHSAKPSPLAENPGYRVPEALRDVALTGAAIDTSEWRFRKAIQTARPGAQQLELDLDVLAGASADLRDLRVVSDDRQLPFLLERTVILRSLPLVASTVADPKAPTVSRWSLKLPRAGLPITRLACTTSAPLFQREMRLWEEVADERGDKFPRELGRATWKQTPGRTTPEFSIALNAAPSSDALLLETDNGDNPAIELRDFRAAYPATRIVFKTTPDAAKPLWLYYGRPEANAPRYDLGLVAGELLRAEKTPASLAAEEPLKASEWHPGQPAPVARAALWVVLGLVVLGLLWLIARLLPKTG